MALWATCGGRPLRHFVVAAFVAGLGLTGCGKQAGAPDQPQALSQPPQAAAAAPDSAGGDPDPAAPAVQPSPHDDGLHQPFTKATRRGDDPPGECNRPPDLTVTGKPVYKLYTEVVRLWDTIRFVSPAGKRLAYSATVETDLGDIEIALKPQTAPNHVRNFVALARAGYYDGLRFDRIYHEESDDQPGMRLDQIEAGCPLGTGEPGNGSIGYWLNPEFPEPGAGVTHEEGTVGACRGSEPDTAACRFYITLCKAPYLDGNYTVFGQVTKGLDVARKIYQQPVIVDEQDRDDRRRPEKPVLIRKVTIHTREAEAK
jgi:cyclophilin family peptidyl-prolyl cis-trans isomerase